MLFALLLPIAFELPDLHGAVRSSDEWRSQRVLVVAFLGGECPVAGRYDDRLALLARDYAARNVAFVGIGAEPRDSAETLRRLEKRLGFPLLRDPHLHTAKRLGATRVPEVVVLDEGRRVRYRGRIDDQDAPNRHLPRPTRRDLVEAVEDLLAGRAVRVPRAPAAGCLIDYPETTGASPAARPTYYEDVRPILAAKCVVCHRDGGIAPFALTDAKRATRWASTIGEVVRERTMPPWHADPAHGRFTNDPSLSDEQRRTIAEWVAGGAVAGEPTPDPTPPPTESWGIGPPDLVLPIPYPYEVPAEGDIPYQYFEVDPGFTEDRWIRAAEVRPGNRAVVHHCTVYLRPPGHPEATTQGELKSFCLVAYAMGTPPLRLPEGMAKKIPAGWKLVFAVHYTPAGPGMVDRTSIGLRFADAKTVRREVATNLLIDNDFAIPPHAAAFTLHHTRRFEKDVLLLALFPHMHLRGTSFRYEVEYPDGRKDVLLNVPQWDMNWQHRYELAEPLRLPAGTVLHGIATYDNSSANPNNPDPSVEVRVGLQTTDEMFNGYYDFVLADEDVNHHPNRRRWLLAAGVGLLGLWFVARRCAKPRATHAGGG